MYGVLKWVYGSVPRAVASAIQSAARSLPPAALIQLAFPYTQSQNDLNGARRHWYSTGSGSDRAPVEEPSPQGARSLPLPALCRRVSQCFLVRFRTYCLRIRYEITSDSWATPASVVVRTNSSK
jgi:hypothetical protein